VRQERPALVLFARAPVAGAVKTRLAALLGSDGAARLYRAFLEDAARLYAAGRWRPVLYAEGDPDDRELAVLFGSPWRREAQSGGDLGRRLAEAFRAERSRGAKDIVAVGSDHPALARAALAELLEAISRGEYAAVIPAQDGGYCAIALGERADPEAIFDRIPWSSAATLEATLRRIRALALSAAVLDPSYDVDRPEDLTLLRDDLARRDPTADDFPRATAAALARLEAQSPG
jgi:rSAM/selenodomain-associated transferase 1